MSQHKILTEGEISTNLQNIGDWRVQDGKLCSKFTFNDFVQAIAFINEIATLAEEMDHHPEFCNAYNKVTFSFCTHDVGNKITDTDIEMATKISEVARNLVS